jgi:hypothetical protein
MQYKLWQPNWVWSLSQTFWPPQEWLWVYQYLHHGHTSTTRLTCPTLVLVLVITQHIAEQQECYFEAIFSNEINHSRIQQLQPILIKRNYVWNQKRQNLYVWSKYSFTKYYGISILKVIRIPLFSIIRHFPVFQNEFNKFNTRRWSRRQLSGHFLLMLGPQMTSSPSPNSFDVIRWHESNSVDAANSAQQNCRIGAPGTRNGVVCCI